MFKFLIVYKRKKGVTHSFDQTNRNIPLGNIQNTLIELDELPLQKDEAQSSKNPVTSDNQKIPPLTGFNSIIANQIEGKDKTKVTKMPIIPCPGFSCDHSHKKRKDSYGFF